MTAQILMTVLRTLKKLSGKACPAPGGSEPAFKSALDKIAADHEIDRDTALFAQNSS